MTEIDELRQQLTEIQQEQRQRGAQQKIDTAWAAQAGDAPNVLKRAAVAEIGPKAIRELMSQEGVDEQVSEFLKLIQTCDRFSVSRILSQRQRQRPPPKPTNANAHH